MNVDAPENDGNASISEQFKRPNTWRKLMMMNYLLYKYFNNYDYFMKKNPSNPWYNTLEKLLCFLPVSPENFEWFSSNLILYLK